MRSVKDRLLTRKKDYEELQQSLLAAGKELHGEDYSPSVSAVVSPVKRKVEPSKQTLGVRYSLVFDSKDIMISESLS